VYIFDLDVLVGVEFSNTFRKSNSDKEDVKCGRCSVMQRRNDGWWWWWWWCGGVGVCGGVELCNQGSPLSLALFDSMADFI